MNIFLSAHYDDAVLSCGELIKQLDDVKVITVFGGYLDGLTDYDAKCGFASSKEANEARRIENNRACLILEAETLNLDYLDSQYGKNNELEMTEHLKELCKGHQVYAPIGIMHPDHELLNRIAQVVGVTYYEDIPHRVIWSDLMVDKIRSLNLTQIAMPSGEREIKRSAIEQYSSQLQDDLQMEWCLAPERYWRET